MKRKRRYTLTERQCKFPKLDGDSELHSTSSLLRVYYPHVTTLRHYLASKLSKHGRKRILQYGVSQGGTDVAGMPDPAVADLLDSVLVGSFRHPSDIQNEGIDKEITVFTQRLSEHTPNNSLMQEALKQSEIVDFVIWLLFKRQSGARKPAHILCHGYQRHMGTRHGNDLAIVPGIPGILSSCRNQHVDDLKSHPWTLLPNLIGKNAEKIISDMLLECGIYVPVGQSSNLSQLSGTPLSDMKPLRVQSDIQDPVRPVDTLSNRAVTACRTQHGLSDIRFVRYRMLYGKPTLSSKGRPRPGLGFKHVLNRFNDPEDPSETYLVMKYVFPRQFGLHNVFTSKVDQKETGQPLRDYTLRDKEIGGLKLQESRQQRHLDGVEAGEKRFHLPKRLRGEVFLLVERIRKRHKRCPYHALLQHYCPQHEGQDPTVEGSVSFASTVAQVSAFCRAAVNKVFPPELWGSGTSGVHNHRLLEANIDQFVRLRRYESMTMHEVLQPIKIRGVRWLGKCLLSDHKLCKSDFDKRRELMGELLYYVFDSFLIPLIRETFHVTESNVHRNQLFFFRQDTWKAMCEPALNSLKNSIFEKCSNDAVKKMLSTRALGVSQVRLLPKEQGMRPIINLRRRVQNLQHGQVVLGKSINSILTPVFSVLNYERCNRPEMLRSALFSVSDIFPRLQKFRESLQQRGDGGKPLYFAKVDVQACFDTIPQKRLMALTRRLLRPDGYRIKRYARGKLLGGHNEFTPGFGTKPSWKFFSKATSNDEDSNFLRDVERDIADGRSHSVYIDGVMQRTERRRAILDLLEEHVEANLIKIGKKFYRQKTGIPQGSVLSSLLCSYIYAELEREVLGFLDDGNTLLLRLIDDFLVISTDRSVAQRFMTVMHNGVPEYGIQVKAEKSRANFDVDIPGKVIERLPETTEFPYCGNAINTATLNITKDRARARRGHIADSVTVEYTRLPGQSFYRKILSAIKLHMQTMLLSTNYNSIDTVLSNLYHSFAETALKSYHYIRALPTAKQPGDKVVIRAVDDLIQLSCALMRRRGRSSKAHLPYECCVTNSQARWLACTAFTAVFRRRQTKHRELLFWLQRELAKPAQAAQGKRLAPVANGYTMQQ